MNVLVTFAPLEPYTFGTDQTFTYPGTGKTGKESYLATSHRIPEQTTVLGALRYLVLENRGLLKANYAYTESELSEISGAVGAESFSFQKTEQSFGEIRALSPLFLFREERRSILIPNPFHNTADKTGYLPMRLGTSVPTSEGEVALPEPGQYSAKKGHAGGFLDLSTLEAETELFRSDFIPGNRKAAGGDREKSYYRREVVRLREGFCFAVLADVGETALPGRAVVYMGLKRSAFRVSVCPASALFPDAAGEDTPAGLLRSAVESRLSEGGVWYYALSDLRLSEAWVPGSFCIVEKKSIRNMETFYREGTEARRRKRGAAQVHLAAAGSVFSGEAPKLTESANLQAIGYNVVCKLGGR